MVMALLPLATLVSPFTLYPALFLAGGIEAIVQPARLAGVPALVGPDHVEKANAQLLLLLSLGQVAGFALAGLLIVALPQPRLLSFPHVVDEIVLLSGSMSSLGAALSWFHQRLGADQKTRPVGEAEGL